MIFSPASVTRLSASERRLIHAVGFVAQAILHDERLELVITGMRADLRAVPDRPDTKDLIATAAALCAAFRRRTSAAGSMEWATACFDARGISQSWHWAALAMLDGV